MNINFKDLNILVKFISNKVGYTEFETMMMKKYNDEEYIERLWPSFRDNPLMFIVSRYETQLFNDIFKEISKLDYKG